MREEALERIVPLLEVLRAHPALREVRPTVFHLDDREFLHFHDEPDGIFADVRLTKGRVRKPVSSRSEQAELLEVIGETLSSLESRVRSRQRHSGSPATGRLVRR